MAGSFRRIDHETVLDGHLVSFAHVGIEGPDGARYERDVVHHPGAVSVVPVHEDGTAVLVRQYRAALDDWLLEIPAGKRDVPGEAPELTAARELAEEVGLRADRLERLAEFYNSPGFCDEHSTVFLATGLHAVPDARHSIEERHLTVETVTLADVPVLIADGTLVDAKSQIGLLLALRRWEG